MNDCKLTIGKFSFFLLLLVCQAQVSYAQIAFAVTDTTVNRPVIRCAIFDINNVPVSYAFIRIYVKGKLVDFGVTDHTGNYTFELSRHETVVDVNVAYSKYKMDTIRSISVYAGKTMTMYLKGLWSVDPFITLMQQNSPWISEHKPSGNIISGLMLNIQRIPPYSIIVPLAITSCRSSSSMEISENAILTGEQIKHLPY